MKEQVKEVYKIEIESDGKLKLYEHSYTKEKLYLCPFNPNKFCGTWCIHFGKVHRELGSYDYYCEDYDQNYILKLTCGCGIIIKANECEDNEE